MINFKKIKFYKKKVIFNPKGNIMKYMNQNDKHYVKFGEIYFTWIKKNYLKGWKFHTKMHMNLTVPVGKIRCIFYDKKSNKKSIFNLSEKNFGTLYVPPKIWFAFQNLDKKKNSLLVNFSNIVHDKNETINKDFEEI
jgi:dTDP-4-dehydrorhamnose 3,5-epimerase